MDSLTSLEFKTKILLTFLEKEEAPMLEIVKNFDVKNDKQRMLSGFVPSVLIEVVAENYRYLMHESAYPADDRAVDPPLRANERVLSGLFATAISRVAPRSKPEVRVTRAHDADDAEEESGHVDASTGRVDYLAWYGDQTIAIELKSTQVNVDSDQIAKRPHLRWDSVNAQAKSAQEFLKLNQAKYPKPSSIGILVLIGRRTVADMEKAAERSRDQEEFGSITQRFSADGLLHRSLRPQFHANYIVPIEFRGARRKRRGEDAQGAVFVPIISFFVNHY